MNQNFYKSELPLFHVYCGWVFPYYETSQQTTKTTGTLWITLNDLV